MLRICSLFVCLLIALPVWSAQPEFTGVPRIIDGDTLVVAGQRIRLGGIDAPELRETCVDGAGRDWPCGIWAKKTADAILSGQTLHCVDLGFRSYDRTVGRCYLKGKDISISLIEAGVARPCLRHAREQGQEHRYMQAKQRAVSARAGVYAGPTNPVAGFCEVRNTPVRRPAFAASQLQTCIIKGNVSTNGRIYHLPGQRYYEQVTMRGGEARWFCTEAQAQKAGWRRAYR